MGDVRVTAAATLAAAGVAVVGSIIVVALNARVQRRLLARQLQGQAAERRGQWAEERRRAGEGAQVDACVRFEAAVVIALARMQRVLDLADHPVVRRRLLGRRWAQQWVARIHDALDDLALPYCAIRYAASPPLLAAADAVMAALVTAGATASAVPKLLPPHPLSLLTRPAVKRWRAQVDAAHGEVYQARRALLAALDRPTPSGTPSPASAP